jgi:hypothetical protein
MLHVHRRHVRAQHSGSALCSLVLLVSLILPTLEAVRKGQRSRSALLSFSWLPRPFHLSIEMKTPAACCRKRLTGRINSAMEFGLSSLFVQPLITANRKNAWRATLLPL